MAVKVPATETGLLVASQLAETGCAVTLTAVYNPAQVVLAAGFGAAYAAPYLGRINDLTPEAAEPAGDKTILTMHDILRNTRSATRLLVASIRSATEVIQLASWGPGHPDLLGPWPPRLLTDPNTLAAAADFERAAGTAGKVNPGATE